MRIYDLRNATYLRGGPDSPEIVEIPVLTSDGKPVTTCVIHVALLEAGVKKYPCGDGDDVKLMDGQRLAVMQFVSEKRAALRGTGPKTLAGWKTSGLRSIEEYLLPGDEVDDDMVDHFRNVFPPLCDRSGLMQMGEPYSTERDEKGQYRATFLTFDRGDNDKWRYAGLCFAGEAAILKRGSLASAT